MNTLTKDFRQRLLRILFFTCEAAFVASFAANEVLWRRYHRAGEGAVFGFAILISLIALLIVCFCLRRTERLLAVIGWITAFVLLCYGMLTPEL